MIISTEVEVVWHGSNKNHFVKKGYIFTKMRDVFMVKVEDLPLGSSSVVEVKCDYCEDLVLKDFGNYNLNRKKLSKDSCSKKECVKQKREESNLKNKGVKSHFQLEEVQAKIAKTNLERFGVENVFANTEIKEKIAKTNLDKYGVENPFQSEMIKEKIKARNLENLGVEYPMQSLEVQEKGYNTKSKNNTINLSGTFPMVNGIAASRPQLELGIFLNGKVNERVSGKCVDILLEKDGLVIEYDGGGHTLDVKTNRITAEVFYERESKSQDKILSDGWRMIRIANQKDKVFDFTEIKTKIDEFLSHNDNYLLINIS